MVPVPVPGPVAAGARSAGGGTWCGGGGSLGSLRTLRPSQPGPSPPPLPPPPGPAPAATTERRALPARPLPAGRNGRQSRRSGGESLSVVTGGTGGHVGGRLWRSRVFLLRDSAPPAGSGPRVRHGDNPAGTPAIVLGGKWGDKRSEWKTTIPGVPRDSGCACASQLRALIGRRCRRHFARWLKAHSGAECGNAGSAPSARCCGQTGPGTGLLQPRSHPVSGRASGPDARTQRHPAGPLQSHPISARSAPD